MAEEPSLIRGQHTGSATHTCSVSQVLRMSLKTWNLSFSKVGLVGFWITLCFYGFCTLSGEKRFQKLIIIWEKNTSIFFIYLAVTSNWLCAETKWAHVTALCSTWKSSEITAKPFDTPSFGCFGGPAAAGAWENLILSWIAAGDFWPPWIKFLPKPLRVRTPTWGVNQKFRHQFLPSLLELKKKKICLFAWPRILFSFHCFSSSFCLLLAFSPSCLPLSIPSPFFSPLHHDS